MMVNDAFRNSRLRLPPEQRDRRPQDVYYNGEREIRIGRSTSLQSHRPSTVFIIRRC